MQSPPRSPLQSPLQAPPLAGFSLAVCLMAVLLLLGGCEPQLDSKVLQSKIAGEIAEQLKLEPENVTVSCPGEVSGKEGEQIKCEVLLSVAATVSKTQKDKLGLPEGWTAFALQMKSDPGFMQKQQEAKQLIDAQFAKAAQTVLADPTAHPFDRLQQLAPLQRQRAEATVTVSGRGQVTWTLQNITPFPK